MVEFKTVPGAESTSRMEPLLVQASTGDAATAGQGMFTLEEWLFIAIAGMFLSLVMIVVTLLRSFFRARRERLAKVGKG